MIVFKKVFTILLFLSSLLLTFSGANASEMQKFAYVACNDSKIYKIDLNKNELVYVSDQIEEMGMPTAIDIDRKQKKLYIASGSFLPAQYSPIMEIDINTTPLKVVNHFDIQAEQVKNKKGKIVRGVMGVYSLKVWPQKNILLVGYAHPKHNKGTTIINSKTGKILGNIKGIPFSYCEVNFSPSGSEVSSVWGKGRGVYNLIKNKITDKKINRELYKDEVGLNAPWKEKNQPFYKIEDASYITAINRKTGETLSKIDLKQLTGGLGTQVRFVSPYNHGTKIIIPVMQSMEKNAFAVVIDLEHKSLINKIEIGPGPTNIVVVE